MDIRGKRSADASESPRRHDCIADGVKAGFIGLGVSGVVGGLATVALNSTCKYIPTLNLINNFTTYIL